MKKNLTIKRSLAALLLAAATVTARTVPTQAADKAGRVSGIKVSETDGDTAITIAASAKPTFTTYKLERPARVIIDISAARLGDLEVPFDAGTYAVGAVSASTSEDEGGARTRVVLTLRQPADYKIESRGNDIVVRVVPFTRPTPAAAKGNDAEAKRLAEERARTEEARKKAEAARLQAQTEQQKADAAKQQAASAKAELQAAHRELAEERVRIEEARKQSVAARQQAEQEKAQAEKVRKDAEQAQRAAQTDREKADAAVREALAAQKKVEDRAKSASQANAEKAREQLEAARRETERARGVAAKAAEETERARREKVALEAVRSDVEKQRQGLARSEVELKKTQRDADESRKRAEVAERQAEAARLREEQRGAVVKAAAAQVEARRKAMDAKSATQEEQRQELARAERLVSERDAKVKTAAVELAAREKAVASALAKQAALEKAGASEEARKTAATEAALATKERQEALAAAGRSRKDLADAVEARRKEEGRRAQLESERVEEERRLREAVAARTAEEARRGSAEEARRQEEARLADLRASRAKAEAERAKLEADRETLVAELDRMKRPPVAAAKAPAKVAAAPAPKKAVVLAETAPVKAEPAAPRPRSITLRVPSRVQRVDFVDEPTRSSVIIDLDEPSLFAVERTAGRKVTLRLPHADLPSGLERSMDATEYLGPVKVISTYRDGSGAVRVDVDLAEEVPNRVRQDGNRLYWDFQKKIVNMGQGQIARAHYTAGYTISPSLFLHVQVAQAAGVAAPGAGTFRPGGAAKKRYTGRRVDLDFKGADIHNILRLLSDVGQVNIVVADDVKGDVTIKMRDVPWDQALDVVLRGKQLGSVREGNLIRVAPLTVLEKELEQEIARQKQITDVLPTETRLIGVSYAEAKTLQDRAKDLLSTRGKISVDERTNNLIVSDVSKNLALIEELVRNLDTQTSQVVIEARIVEARSTFVRQMGVQWGGTGFADADHGNPTGLAFPYNIGVGGGATDSQAPLGGLVPQPRSGLQSANPNFAVNLPVAAGTGAGGALGLTLGSVAGAFNLNLRLSALESSGNVRILSSPRITTMDNIEASIQQGVAIPISVVSAQGVQTVFVDAILDLTVKPHVTNEGTVMMNINIRRNEPDFVNTGARGDPTILKKEARTSMLIRDGDTAVIGGIYTRNSGLNYAKVPLFADIPILGVMFRNRRENDDRTEFLVFITPRIANRARALGQ
jgi:type IV pilus assembly protein PilQ